MQSIKRVLRIVLIILVVLVIIIGFIAVSINSHVQSAERDKILCAINETKNNLTSQEKKTLDNFDADCIIILGAGIEDSETPSPMLKDRLDVAIMLYRENVAPKVLLSGDNGTVNHNEIHVMLKYMKNAGVPKEDIFCDHAGFSTYDSMYRAVSIFKVKKAIVVTQSYHQYRALYDGEKLGLKVLGVSADQKKYSGQAFREMREVLARNKDYLQVMIKPKAMDGKSIPISGSGVESHGE